MGKGVKYAPEFSTLGNWNSIILSLALSGGYVITEGKMSEVYIFAPKLNRDTLIIETKFLTYWLETRKLKELWQAVFEQQAEIAEHNDDESDEKKQLIKEREEALLELNRLKKERKKHKILIEEAEDIADDGGEVAEIETD
jgi:hypothetical protein